MKDSGAVQCEQLPNNQSPLVQIFVRNEMSIFKTKLLERIKSHDTKVHFILASINVSQENSLFHFLSSFLN